MEILHELGSELRSSIADRLLGYSKLLPHIVVEEFGGSQRRYFSRGGDGYDVLGESVDNHHYCIVSLRYRQSGDEVDGDVFPRLFRDGVWL